MMEYSKVFIDGVATDETVKDALDSNLDIIGTIFGEILNDDENQTQYLLQNYLNSTPEQRAVIDDTLIAVCGWGMNTLIELARDQENYLEE